MYYERFEDFGSAAANERDDEQRAARETARIGSFLKNLYETLPSLMARDKARAHVQRIRTLVFRSQPEGIVWAGRTDYHPQQRNEETLLRAFRIRLIPSNGAPAPEWLINEVVEGGGIKYEPRSLDYGESSGEHDENMIPSAPKDPSPDEMEEAARIMEECWKLYEEGNDNALLISSAPLPSVRRGEHGNKSG